MDAKTIDITDEEANNILNIGETYFVDIKSARIAPSKLTKTISAFANTSGGEIYIGIEEFDDLDGKSRSWEGYADQKAANPIFQVLDKLSPLGNNYLAEFIKRANQRGLVIHLTIFKTQDVVLATDGSAYVRRNAQSLPVANEAAMERLRYDKGVRSFEDEIIHVAEDEITNSDIVLNFLQDIVPLTEPSGWLTKQRVLLDGRPTVAGVLLYSDLPQALLPKRSAIKIYDT